MPAKRMENPPPQNPPPTPPPGTPPPPSQRPLGDLVVEVTENASTLVREEIELAKAEMTEKITKLLRGAVFGIVAGIFAVFALIYLLDALSWGLWEVLGTSSNFWLGFLITGTLILIAGVICGLIAVRMIKKGSPPKPELAIEEAQLIKGTLTAAPASHPVGPVATREAER
jgi:uncharacterized membrane protein YqjE